MNMPCSLFEKLPSPQEDTKLPSVSQMVSGWSPRLNMWTSSIELTATSKAEPNPHYLGIFGQVSTSSYVKSPDPTLIAILSNLRSCCWSGALPRPCSRVPTYMVRCLANPHSRPYHRLQAGVWRSGSALALGARGRRFDPGHPDQISPLPATLVLCIGLDGPRVYSLFRPQVIWKGALRMTQVRDMWMAPTRPNGLQAAPDGMWLMAQSGAGLTDNHAYKLSYEDGSVLKKVPTGLDHAGGITVGGGYVWVTADFDTVQLDFDGNEVSRRMSPGGRGAHGIEWVDEHNMWIVDPGAFKVDLIDPTTMETKRSVPTPVGKKAHGMALYNGTIWQGVTRKDTGGGELYQIDIETGEILHRIDVPEPEIHGVAQHDGLIWFCCAKTHRVCTVHMPA